MMWLRSSIRPAEVSIRLVTRYSFPSVPPDNQMVVPVSPWEDAPAVSPAGTDHVDVEIVSPSASHGDQSKP